LSRIRIEGGEDESKSAEEVERLFACLGTFGCDCGARNVDVHFESLAQIQLTQKLLSGRWRFLHIRISAIKVLRWSTQMTGTQATPALRTAAQTESPASPNPMQWHWLTRVGFRFFFAYFLLYNSSIFLRADGTYEQMWRAVVVWVGKHVLHL